MRLVRLLLTALASFTACQPAPRIAPPSFVNRELRSLTRPGPRAMARMTALNSAAFDPRLERTYRNIKPGRSLLIHDCTVAGADSSWCLAPDFTFARVWARAVGPNPEQQVAPWLNSMASVPQFRDTLARRWPTRALAAAPFHLLAIVNRLDLAQQDAAGSDWSGGEVRFIYGLTGGDTGPARATVIFEFVRQRTSWRQFSQAARAWAALSTTACDGTRFTGCLQQALNGTLSAGTTLVRLRTNTNLGNGSRWHFAQWELLPGRVERRLLSDEIAADCTELRRAATARCQPYLNLWNTWQAGTRHLPISEQSGLLEWDRGYVHAQLGLHSIGMPLPVCDGSQEARLVLSLQSCSGCHSAETQTNFNHVANRSAWRPNGPAQSGRAELSSFLTGGPAGVGADGTLPAFAALQSASPPVHTAKVRFWCAADPSRQPGSVERQYHDLVRRALYLAAVLLTPSHQTPTADIRALIASYTPGFNH